MSKKSNATLFKEWEQRIANLRASGQTQHDWCKANNVSIHSLKYWIRKVEGPGKKENSTNSKWIPMMVKEESPIIVKETLQIKIGQATIDVKPGFDPDFLREVIKALNT
ncbi:IS66 family insertion sequence element accessory protein TnpB [Evansella sp. AB-rgal1]|uniref:IS66 family insertion sequence element accessory protein TnpA n=1 Tax=Evansella sp. AB-rgal1 TaxID=3242696 RepID=UPI00359E34B1